MTPNRKSIDLMIRAVFPNADRNTYAGLRTFEEKNQNVLSIKSIKLVGPKRDELLTAAFQEAVKAANGPRKGVFCLLSATFKTGDKATEPNVANGLAISVDLDKWPRQGYRDITKVLGPATLVLKSGGIFVGPDGKKECKRHAYWRLSQPTRTRLEHGKLNEALKLATEIAGGDATNTNFVHPLRCAGSVHRKGKPKLAKIIECNLDVELDLARALKKLKAAAGGARKPDRKDTPAAKKGIGAVRSPNSAALMAQIICGESYHQPLAVLAARYVASGMAPGAVVEELRSLMEIVPVEKRDVKGGVSEAGRWQARVDEIPRLVSSATEKLDAEAGWLDPVSLPSTMPEVIPITPDMLPEALRGWLVDIAERMQAPLDFVAVAAIAAAGAVVGLRVLMQPKEFDQAWRVSANQYTMIIAHPGMMKTPAARAAMAPLQAIESEFAIENEQKRIRYERDVRAYEGRKRAAAGGPKKGAKAAEDFIEDPPTEPLYKRLIVVDATKEALLKVHAANPNGVLINRDELMPFLNGLDDEKRTRDRELLLLGWTGDQPDSFDRIGRGHGSIDRVCLSVFGSAQPAPLLKYIKKHAGDSAGEGMLQRFGLMVWPDVSKFKFIDRPVDEEATARANKVFRYLHDLTPRDLDLKPGKDGSCVLRFTERAQRRFVRWYTRLQHRVRDGGEGAIVSHLAKYAKLVPSLALLFHLIDRKKGAVGLPELKRALKWARVLEAHMRRVYGTVLREDVIGANALMEHIQKGDLKSPFSSRVLYRKGWTNLKDSKQAEAALQVLIDCNVVRRRTRFNEKRAMVEFEVNPKLLPVRSKGAP